MGLSGLWLLEDFPLGVFMLSVDLLWKLGDMELFWFRCVFIGQCCGSLDKVVVVLALWVV